MYFPVILFVQHGATVGMLMIPETPAYVGIAVVLWRSLYGRELTYAAGA
jgi:hypothetical protein